MMSRAWQLSRVRASVGNCQEGALARRPIVTEAERDIQNDENSGDRSRGMEAQCSH